MFTCDPFSVTDHSVNGTDILWTSKLGVFMKLKPLISVQGVGGMNKKLLQGPSLECRLALGGCTGLYQNSGLLGSFTGVHRLT